MSTALTFRELNDSHESQARESLVTLLATTGAINDGDIDYQPCGGTHVALTAEIGPIQVTSIKSRGARNRRFMLTWAESNIPNLGGSAGGGQ